MDNNGNPNPNVNGEWDNENWNEESLMRFMVGRVYDIYLPVADMNSDLFVGLIEHNSTWWGGSPKLMVPDFATNRYWDFSSTTVGRFGLQMKGQNVHRHPKGVYLPAEVVQAASKRFRENPMKYNGAYKIAIRLDLTMCDTHIYTRGMYTELVNPVPYM